MAKILRLSKKEDLGHVVGKENPADLGSQGVNASQSQRFEDELIDYTIGMRALPTDSFRTEIFYPLIDRALAELNRRFSAENKK